MAHLFKRPHMTPGNCSLMVRISKICLKFIFILVNFEKSTKKNIRQFLILCNNDRRENAHMIEQQLKVFTAEAPWMHMILTFLKIANFQKSNTLRSLNKLLSFLSCCLGHHTIFYKKKYFDIQRKLLWRWGQKYIIISAKFWQKFS